MLDRGQIGVVILAGGEATRLPGKLALDAGEVPMIVRVFRNVSAGSEVYISCKETFPAELDTLLPCPMVVDNWKLRGPLAGLLSTLSEMSSPFVFAVAGDAPFVEAPFIEALAKHWQEGDEAVVPVHVVDGHEQLEPLAAIYERRAFMREGFEVLAGSRGALRRVIERMRTRKVTIGDARIFTNVNTPDDYKRLRAMLHA